MYNNMDGYISASKYYKQGTRVQNGTRPQYQTYYKEYICVVLYSMYWCCHSNITIVFFFQTYFVGFEDVPC